jgi:molybdenum cofactor cytidylyltransferase
LKLAGIILAAGAGVRFGGAKQLASFNGKYLLQYALDAANNSSVDYVSVVVGGHSSEILEKVQLGRAQIIFNRDYKTGIASSVKAGIANLPDDTSGAIIMVADQPFLKTEHLELMIQYFKKNGSNEIVVLSRKGEPRNPALIPRQLFSSLDELTGDSGARMLMKKSDRLHLLDLEDSDVFLDVDTKETLTDIGN